MAKRMPLVFSDEDRATLRRERYYHPHPRVQQRYEVLLLISRGLSQKEAGRLAGVSLATAQRYVSAYRRGGIAALQECHWCGPVSAMQPHRPTIERSFQADPPHTVAEACSRIKALVGVDRRPTAVRDFLKKLSV